MSYSETFCKRLRDIKKTSEFIKLKNESTLSDDYNSGIIILGIEVFDKMMADVDQLKMNIVSFGSGRGIIEKRLKSKTYTVDLYNQAAQYKKMNELIHEHPELYRNSIMLIIWPEPHLKCPAYELQAIYELKPRFLYESTGISGHQNYIEWLDQHLCLQKMEKYFYEACITAKFIKIDKYSSFQLV